MSIINEIELLKRQIAELQQANDYLRTQMNADRDAVAAIYATIYGPKEQTCAPSLNPLPISSSQRIDFEAPRHGWIGSTSFKDPVG